MDSSHLERIRAHLSQTDTRRLAFAAPVQGDLRSGVQRVASAGCALAVVDLDEPLLDRELDAKVWAENIVGRIGDGALEPQLARAGYLSLPAVVCAVDRIGVLERSALAEFVQTKKAHVWLETPWSDEGWRHFSALRGALDHHPQLHVALDVTSPPPTAAVVQRWSGEPVELLIVGEDVSPQLSGLFRSVTERVLLPQPDAPVRASLEQLHRETWSAVRAIERHAAGHATNAIDPIEPLGDDLSGATYEVIESDPVKYRRYTDAVMQAVAPRTDPVHVAVFGAGRGGIVDSVRHAAVLLKRTLTITALEKNPGALETLRLRNEREWDQAVNIVSADMRTWTPPAPIDVIVSELLGGFADNELSPECLAPVERALAEDGVIIPTKYTSWVAPVTAASIHMACKDRERLHTVALDRAVLLADPAPCFVFEHPGPLEFEQHVSLEFEPRIDAVLHGFAGFFDTTLYGDVELSIVPATATDKMRSWQPMFFPLVAPVDVHAGQPIRVTFLRRAAATAVWYEWIVEAPVATKLHNAAGVSFKLRA